MARFRAARNALCAAALAASGCSGEVAPPLIRTGTPCAYCRMPAEDLHFACARASDGAWKVYDAISCMMRDTPNVDARSAYLPDHERYRLHRADSMWVVHGEFQTPMPGGYAAFFERAMADTFAAAHRGVVGTYEEFAHSIDR